MSGMWTIVRKELRTYFYSPVAYVMLGIFSITMGFIFSSFVATYLNYKMQEQMGAQGVTLEMLSRAFFSNMSFMFCFFVPFLTMKLFAEEKSQSTIELLLTAPLRTFQIVLGKYIGAITLMTAMLAASFIYVLFMILWGSPMPDLKVFAGSYFGVFLALASFVALGSAVSAMASSQAIAAVWTFVILMILALFQAVGQQTTATLGPIQLGPTMLYLSPLRHVASFTEGLLQLKDIVYFLSFTIFCLFLTHRVVESNRWR